MVAAINNDKHSVNLEIQDQAFAQQGVAYFDAGFFKDAWNCFNNAIAINPNDILYYYMRAACSASMGNHQAALLDYNKALTLANGNNDRGMVHYDLAILYASIGDENNARSHLVIAARFGHAIAQNVCRQYGIPY